MAELRDLAAEDPWRAQEETWAWIEDLGKTIGDVVSDDSYSDAAYLLTATELRPLT